MKWIGQHIYDLIARFRNDVYLENISTGTIASGGNLGLDSNNKIVKADVPADGDITGISFRPDDANTVGFTSGSADFVLVGSTGIKTTGDGSSTLTLAAHWIDNEALTIGTGNDFTITHDGTDTFLGNNTGNLYITQQVDDKDIIFRSDDGSGGVAEYFRVDGSEEQNLFKKRVRIDHDVSDASVASVGLDIDMDVSGSDTLSSDITQRAIHASLNSTATGGDTSDEHRLIAIQGHSKTSGSGDADDIRGVYGLAQSNRSSSATTSLLRGVHGIAYANDSASAVSTDIRGGDFSCYVDTDGPDVTSMYGIIGNAYTNTNSTDNVSNVYGAMGKAESRGSGTISNAYGVLGEIEVDAGTITTGQCFRAVVDHNGGTLTTGYMYRGTTSGTVGTQWGIHLDGEDKNYFSGNVGIGTTSPNYLLDVEKSGANARLFNTAGSTELFLQCASGYVSSINFGDTSDNNAGRIIYREYDHAMTFTTNTSEAMFIDSSQNVGIGTSSPGNKLEVHSGTTNVAGVFKSSDNQAWISVQDDASGTYGALFGTDSDENHDIVLADRSANKRLVVSTTTGNVGIATNSPSEKLEVTGNIKLSGNLDIGGSVQKQIQVFPMNFVDDLGTDKHFMPFVTNTEQTVNYQEEAAMVMPADGRVVSVTVHYAQMHGSDGNITVGIETSPCGQAYTNTWDIEETETIAASVADDHHVFHFAFDNAKHFESTDKMAISIQQSTAMQNAGRFFWVTAVIEYDWSTFLGGTSAEHTTTP